MKFAMIVAALLATACSAEAKDAVLACQQRISDARTAASDVKVDPFGAEAYAKLDKAGCSPEQIAEIKTLHELAASLKPLSEANEAAGASGDEAKHMEAFQKFNDALIKLDDLQDTATDNLQKMKSAGQ